MTRLVDSDRMVMQLVQSENRDPPMRDIDALAGRRPQRRMPYANVQFATSRCPLQSPVKRHLAATFLPATSKPDEALKHLDAVGNGPSVRATMGERAPRP